MHELPLITTLAAAFTAAWVLGLLTQWLRLSPIVGYLLAGVVIGPYTPGINADVGLGQVIDTTLVFNFARKSWTRTNISAAISVGIADESRGRYAICAGVNALLPTATLTITGARGTVHFAADLRQFTNALRAP